MRFYCSHQSLNRKLKILHFVDNPPLTSCCLIDFFRHLSSGFFSIGSVIRWQDASDVCVDCSLCYLQCQCTLPPAYFMTHECAEEAGVTWKEQFFDRSVVFLSLWNIMPNMYLIWGWSCSWINYYEINRPLKLNVTDPDSPLAFMNIL